MCSDVPLLGLAAQLALASVLLLAGFSKVVRPRDLRQVLVDLGLANRLAGAATAVVIATEIAAGGALLTLPAQAWPRAVALVLAAGFADAGAIALLRRERIVCHCFGSLGSGSLGRRQIALLPVWLLLAGLAQWRPPDWGAETGLLLVSIVLLALAAMEIPRERRLRSKVTNARVALAVGMPSASASSTEGVAP
jgi:hypothetical protein